MWQWADTKNMRATITWIYRDEVGVDQLAELKILKICYGCLDKYISREHFKLIKMDASNFYFVLTDEIDNSVWNDINDQ